MEKISKQPYLIYNCNELNIYLQRQRLEGDYEMEIWTIKIF